MYMYTYIKDYDILNLTMLSVRKMCVDFLRVILNTVQSCLYTVYNKLAISKY